MNKRALRPSARRESGFTLIELLVVVLIIGILAAIAVPQYFKVVEKGKVTDAMHWLGSLKGAQERYLARYGSYVSGPISATSFDSNLGVMTKFTTSDVTVGVDVNGAPIYEIVLTRATPTPAVYGAYTITYTAPPGTMVCSVQACTDDLMP